MTLLKDATVHDVVSWNGELATEAKMNV